METISNLSDEDLTFPSGDRVGAKSSGEIPSADLSSLVVKGWLAEGRIGFGDAFAAQSASLAEKSEPVGE